MTTHALAPALPPLVQSRPRDWAGPGFTALTGLAAALIVLMVAIILGNVAWFGARTLTWEFVSAAPRHGMTEGGIFPAIYGTVLLVLLMIVALIPFGVGAGIWLHEYAPPQAPLTRSVRFAVTNLAAVPSIVYGLFGLGFFIQFIGHGIDRALGLDVVWGQPALLWAALTLAMLNLPVVIVTTEEALKTVPREMREASMGLGASRWQTVWHVLLPQAMPGILTGMILAVARGAGEVAPLMLVGVVKLAPALPVDGFWPFVHLDRKFMHLGFHIYDVGFQSPNVDAARPMVFATTLLLLLIVVFLNLFAISMRNRLRRKYATSAV